MFNCLSIAFTYFPISYCYNFLNKLLFNFSQSAILLQIYLQKKPDKIIQCNPVRLLISLIILNHYIDS